MRTHFSHINDVSHYELINETYYSSERREYALVSKNNFSDACFFFFKNFLCYEPSGLSLFFSLTL
jgi:hypothetical protein